MCVRGCSATLSPSRSVPRNPSPACRGGRRAGAASRARRAGTDGALRALSDAAIAYADGDVHLTSRGNLQLRGIGLDECGAVPAGLAEVVTAAGLLPSASHERVRNIVASPLSGLAGGLTDVRPLVRELDAGLCADPVLADLPGRFLFGLDDGRGDSRRCGAISRRRARRRDRADRRGWTRRPYGTAHAGPGDAPAPGPPLRRDSRVGMARASTSACGSGTRRYRFRSAATGLHHAVRHDRRRGVGDGAAGDSHPHHGRCIAR